ncbi:MAG TPA: biotin-independent malonate decarboxylase subunit beta [Mycobacterium sp.]|jgi:malonate decarboxylase beta subunit|nr:biotin-independent malonate decarboxylase subunit beta [Mycobacterium sp.]
MTSGVATRDWKQILARASFLEGDALERAEALLDPDSVRVLCGPFDRLESPWLLPQGIVPQADDGVVIARGTLDGRPAVIASIEQGFQGGGTGEVSGAKISQALRLAADASRAGTKTAAILLFETGGVRLQEANLGLNAVAEICSAILDLRPMAPVIGVVAGEVGSFGGMSIAAGLCTQLIITPQGRIGLNGPAVIEQEAGVDEFDSSDRALIWSIDGGEQREATGLADKLIADDRNLLRAAVIEAVAADVSPVRRHRSERIDVLGSRLASLDPANPPAPQDLQQMWGPAFEAIGDAAPAAAPTPPTIVSRGRRWLSALAATEPATIVPSVIRADAPDATYLAVVPDAQNPFHRARNGEVGLTESWALAATIDDIVTADTDLDAKRAIVAVVDLPSQAYGRIEEMAGLHQAIATAVDAYHRARSAGHPIVAIVVGHALSGGFLAHGLQAQQILALDDPGVEIHAMHKSAAARITLRTVAELEKLAETVVPLSYNVRDWAQLGLCDGLLTVSNADDPTADDVAAGRTAIDAAIAAARSGPRDLSNRLDSPGALTNRTASRAVRDLMSAQWHETP